MKKDVVSFHVSNADPDQSPVEGEAPDAEGSGEVSWSFSPRFLSLNFPTIF